jgi:hypothetical protein
VIVNVARELLVDVFNAKEHAACNGIALDAGEPVPELVLVLRIGSGATSAMFRRPIRDL